MDAKITKLFTTQLEEWEFARTKYKELEFVQQRALFFEDAICLVLNFNPARILSATAKVDSKSLQKRPCFLCENNRPKEQKGILIAEGFLLLVNPFPIFQRHFTIVHQEHTFQKITPHLNSMLEIATKMKEYTVFYNGAKCGASAPDHLHFQVGNSAEFPIWSIFEQVEKEVLLECETYRVFAFENYVKAIVIEGGNRLEVAKIVNEICAVLGALQPLEPEPMFNILMKYEEGWKIVIFPRKKHRPSQYFAEGKDRILLSPATVELAGLLVLPRKEDFERMDTTILKDIFAQICLDTNDFEYLKEKIKQLCN
ncbi:MAG: DUF4922 domain-containing protein [Flavobacteriaceae bacterium]|nr:DUF4922 domain-containing protein [Flavobacteriaceae bacterium]